MRFVALPGHLLLLFLTTPYLLVKHTHTHTDTHTRTHPLDQPTHKFYPRLLSTDSFQLLKFIYLQHYYCPFTVPTRLLLSHLESTTLFQTSFRLDVSTAFHFTSPVNTQRHKNVVTTSLQRRDVAATL